MEFSTPEAVCRLCFSNATLYLFFELLVKLAVDQLWTILKGTASLTQWYSLRFNNINPKVTEGRLETKLGLWAQPSTYLCCQFFKWYIQLRVNMKTEHETTLETS